MQFKSTLFRNDGFYQRKFWSEMCMQNTDYHSTRKLNKDCWFGHLKQISWKLHLQIPFPMQFLSITYEVTWQRNSACVLWCFPHAYYCMIISSIPVPPVCSVLISWSWLVAKALYLVTMGFPLKKKKSCFVKSYAYMQNRVAWTLETFLSAW